MTTPLRSETLPVREQSDILLVRQFVREWAAELGFGVFDQTRIATAASELGRNTLVHGGGGTMLLETFVESDRRGLRLIFEDLKHLVPSESRKFCCAGIGQCASFVDGRRPDSQETRVVGTDRWKLSGSTFGFVIARRGGTAHAPYPPRRRLG